jgi:hypothetical protein
MFLLGVNFTIKARGMKKECHDSQVPSIRTLTHDLSSRGGFDKTAETAKHLGVVPASSFAIKSG